MVGVSRWLTLTVRIAKAVATRARSCCPVSSGQPPADPYAYRMPALVADQLKMWR